jgi:hypothetical protein
MRIQCDLEGAAALNRVCDHALKGVGIVAMPDVQVVMKAEVYEQLPGQQAASEPKAIKKVFEKVKAGKTGDEQGG